MSTVKKPQDRKPKKPSKKKIEGGWEVTVDGITVVILEEALDDWELVEAVRDSERGQGARAIDVAERLFGDEYRDVLEKFRGDNGRVSVQRFLKFIQEVFTLLSQNS